MSIGLNTPIIYDMWNTFKDVYFYWKRNASVNSLKRLVDTFFFYLSMSEGRTFVGGVCSPRSQRPVTILTP